MVLLLGWWCHLCLEGERIAPLEIPSQLQLPASFPQDCRCSPSFGWLEEFWLYTNIQAGFVQAALYTTRRINTLDLSLTRGWELEDLCINTSWGLEGVVKRKFFISNGAILSSSKHKWHHHPSNKTMKISFITTTENLLNPFEILDELNWIPLALYKLLFIL